MDTVVEQIFCDIATFPDVNKVLHSCLGLAILIKEAGIALFRSRPDWKTTDLFSAIKSNVLKAIELMQIILPSMIKKLGGMVKALMPALGLLNLVRSGLPSFVVEISRQVVGDGVCINNLLPKIYNFNRIKGFNKTMVRKLNISIEQVLKKKIARTPTSHYRNLIGFGNMCSFLYWQHASFIVGQNIDIDGGTINATK